MKKNIIALISILFVMLILPLLTVTFAPSDAGMALCFIMFFAVNPIYSALLGIYSGLSVKKRWFVPLISAAVFLLSCWILFDAGEIAFLTYSIAYFLISFVVAMITALVKK